MPSKPTPPKPLSWPRPICPPPHLCFNLTEREREVLHWMTEGKRNREIGVIMQISFETVKKHVGNIFGKLGVETRTAAVFRVRGFNPDERKVGVSPVGDTST